jgi:hypothetical protein
MKTLTGATKQSRRRSKAAIVLVWRNPYPLPRTSFVFYPAPSKPSVRIVVRPVSGYEKPIITGALEVTIGGKHELRAVS